MNYFDKYNMLSDRANNVSGNQPWYSALFSVFGGYSDGQINEIRLVLFNEFVCDTFDRLDTLRYPDNFNPDSHDNILAHIYFKSITNKDLEKTDYYINATLPSDYSWYECFKDIYRLIKDHGLKTHRNTWWEEGYLAIGKIANKLPIFVRWYASRSIKYLPAFLLHILISYVKPNFKKQDRQTNNVSAKIQCWFILKTTGSKYLIKLFDIKKLCNIYFDDPEHPIVKLLND